ncbi:BapA/Bap/LapF family large adhesin [Brenneria sp. EniD312]|uniref:BapA/Bap/LapF family large adhesin n=1 Tax=Brenneria sp. EniD312 TaxID=598467 RepID=UPI0002ED4C69|nr:Ig-like domain repeat protein [Brenneria sp. EniD312]
MAGVIAIASDRHDDDDNERNTRTPEAPTVNISEDGTAISGEAEPGSIVTVTLPDGLTIESIVDTDGSWRVTPEDLLTNGETVSVVVTDPAGNTSTAVIVTAPDTTAPAAPADLLVAEDGSSVSGSAEPGSTVTISDAAGNELGSVTVGDDGSFTVPLTPALTNGETISAVASDAAGNASAAVSVTAPDATAPSAPADLLVAEDGASVSGSAEAGSTVTISDAAGNELGSVTVGEDGSFTVPLTPALTNGEAISAVASDAAGNVSTAATVTAPDLSVPDTTAPDAPVAAVSEDGLTVSGTAEPNSTVTVTLPDTTTLTTTADAFGVYGVVLPTALTNGETVTVTATDASGNVSVPATATAPDTTAPAAPGALLVAEDGASVSGSAEPGSTVTISDAAGNALGSVTVGEDGSFTVPLTPALTNGEAISAVASDAAGNTSGAATATAPDTTAPAAPGALLVAEDGASVSGSAEPGSTVTISDAAGNELGSVTVGEDGSFTVPLTPALTNGEAISAVASDAAGNTSAAATVIAPDTTAPDAPVAAVSEDGLTVSGTAEPNSTVTVTLPDTTTLTTTADASGVYGVVLPTALTNGETVTVTATDASGNVSVPATATAPDTTAPAAPGALLVAEDGASVSGSAEPGSTVTISDAAGNALGSVTVGEDGSFTVPLTPALTNGEAISAVASDAAGNTSAAATVIAPDATAPEAPVAYINDDGTVVNGTAEPNSTVTVTLSDTTTLTTTADASGVYGVVLPTALTNGETVTVTATDASGNVSVPATATAPDLTAPLSPADLLVAEDGSSVSGSAEAGSTVTISDAAGNELGSVTVGEDGGFTVPLTPALTNGEAISVVASDSAGNTSAAATIIAPDTTAPDAPVAYINDDGTAVNGTAEAGSTVTVTLPDNSTRIVTAADDGTWGLTMPEALTAGEQLTITATDGAGNTSVPATVTAPDLSVPDTTAPDAPVAAVSEDGLTVSGTAEPNSTVTVTLPDTTTLTTTADASGVYGVVLPTALTNGETVTVTATDAAGNVSVPATATAPDATAPSAPADLLVAEDGSSVSGSAEAGSTVTISDAASNELGSVTVGEDGGFIVPLTPALTNGEAISAVASDAAGNASAAVSVTAPDTTAPSTPADLSVAEDGLSVSGSAEPGSTVTISDAAGNELGSVTVGEDDGFIVPLTPALTNGEAISAVASDAAGNTSAAATVIAPDTTAPDAPVAYINDDGTAVNGTAEAGSTVTVTLPDNSTRIVTAADDGAWGLTLPEALTAGEQLTITATDGAGNTSVPATVTAPDLSVPDTTAPDAPVAYINDDGTVVNGTAEPNSTVTVTLPDTTTLTTTADASGVYGVVLPTALTNGETVTVTATDAAGNVSVPATATAPDLTAPLSPADLLVAEDGSSVSGSAEAGSTVTISDAAGNELGSVTVGEDGSFIVPLTPALTNGEIITAVASDAAGNTSAAATVTAPDLTAPLSPADLLVAEDGSSVSGSAEAGSTVTISDAADNELGSVTVGEDGSFTVTLTPALTNGEIITAVASDAAGNTSAAATVIAPDTTAPDAPVAYINDDGTVVNGTAEPNSTVTVTLPDTTTLTTTADASGVYGVVLPTALTNGETVTVTATDAAGNVSVPATATAPDLTAPLSPADLLVAEDGSSVSGSAEAGSTVTISDAAGNELGSVTVGEDGSFTVPLTPALTNGEAISAVASDAAGNTSAAATVIAPDATAPNVPVAAVSEDGLTVSGTAEPNSTVTVTLPDTTTLTTTADASGVYGVVLPTALTNGETVTVTATDASGNVSVPATATAPDATAPAAPADLLVAEDGSSVSGSAEAGSTVTISDATGNELGSVTVGEDGSFTVPLTPALTNGEAISAVASDAAGNTSAAATVIAPDTTAPEAPVAYINDDGTAVNGTAEAGSTVTVTLPDNSTRIVTAADDGAWGLTLPEALTAGEQLTITATDGAGNTSVPATVTAPDLSVPDTTAPDAPVAAVSEDGLTVSGTAEPNSTVTVTLPDTTTLTTTADASGVYGVVLPTALTNGETVTVTATDAAGNVSVPTTATAPDTTAPAAPADLLVAEDGSSVSGHAEAGSTVTISDAAGNELGSVTVGEDGNFTVPLTPALTNGEIITAVASDAVGNGSNPATVTAPDTTAPDAPSAAISADGGSISGVAEGGSTVTITLADGSVATVQANAQGNYSYDFPSVQANGESVSVTATDAAGNISPATSVTAPVLELAANDNEVLLALTTDAAVTTESYSDWGLLVVGALGNIASLLGNDSAQVSFTIDNGATADVALEANATGGVLSLLNSMGVMVQQYSADTDSWNTVIDTANSQWASLLTIGSNGVTLNLEDMSEGTYRVLAYNTTLLAVGSYISVAATVTQTAAGVVSGETSYSGNLITDDDPAHGADITPAGTVVTQIANGAGDVVAVTLDGTTIQGEYGTLTINPDGSYTYTLTDTSTAVLGRVDSFTYTVTGNGATSTAELLVSLGTEINAPGNVIAVDDSAFITFDTTVDAIDNGTSSQSGFTVLNLGLGSVLSVGILDDLTNPIIFDVEEGTTRTMTLQSSVGGVSVLSGFDLYVYKFNAATQQYDQYRVVEDWLTVVALGASSSELTLTLQGGQYLFLLDTAYGISALTGYTLNILEDHVYTVETVSASTSGNVMEDDTAPADSVIGVVNGVAIAAEGITSVTGAYGVLTIDAQGNYTYTLNAGVGADSITAPDSFVYTVTAPDGESDSGTLNINLVSRPLTAVEDSVTLAATAVQEETSYSDSDAGSVTWSSRLTSSSSASTSGTVTVAEQTAVKDASITFNVNSLLSLSSLSIGWTLLSSDGTQLASGTVSSDTLLGSSATVSLGGLELAAGDYTLNFTGSIGALSLGSITVSASVTGTSVLLDDFQTETAAVTGNIFDGSGSEANAADQLVSVETTLSIADVNGNVTTLDPYVTSDSTVTVQGKYGVLTLNIDGEYSYTLNSDVALTDITEKETFNYTLTAADGETAGSALTIDLALQLNGSSHSDTATSSAYGDTFVLGGSGDSLIFSLLNAADATGGNGSDIWTDFSLADGDRIDVSQLLQGWDSGTSDARDWLSVEIIDGNTVISIDRDGQGTEFGTTPLVTLQGVQATLDELLENNSIIT